MDLVVEVYRLVKVLPDEEKFNLSSQMRQAVVSIPANIAEGAARRSKKEFSQFLHIAQASLSELDTHLEAAKRLGYLSESKINSSDLLMVRIDKMLTGLIRFKGSSPHA